MSTRSLRARLVTAVVATTGVVLVVLAIVLYAGVRNAAWQQHDDGLAARARALSAIVEFEDGSYELELPREPGVYLEVWRPDESPLARSQTLTSDLPRRLGFFDLKLADGREGQALGIRFTPRGAHDGRPGTLTLVIAAGTEDVDAAVASVRTWFVVLGFIALAAIAAVTAWSLARGLAPLARLAGDIERIDDRNLATRLPLEGQPTELVVPVRKLNELLARLARSFARERELTADVSHELRTPLAGLRTLLEVTALTDRSTADYKDALREAHAIVLQLGVLVENLLALARLDGRDLSPAGSGAEGRRGSIDAGHGDLAIEDFALRSLVEECWRPHARLAASRSLELRLAVPRGAIVRADREKLRIIVGNLLANAAEYTERGGWIEIATGDGALVDVIDSGPAIADTEKIFERLWRGDAARTGTGVHCGIGLALARSLCTSARLAISATNRPDGSVRFRVTQAAT